MELERGKVGFGLEVLRFRVFSIVFGGVVDIVLELRVVGYRFGEVGFFRN